MVGRVAFHTLGCKLNQSETAVIQRGFEQRGFQIVEFGEAADIIFINTCSVTGEAESRCRQAIRKGIKFSPQAQIVVGGCLSQVKGESLKNIPGVRMVLGGGEKFKVLEYLESEHDENTVIVSHSDHQNQFALEESFGYATNRTRAFLKIQDGCTYCCTFCIIPTTRGPSRSRSSTSVYTAVLGLVEDGFKEVVLTGVNLVEYNGQEVGDLTGLIRLLDTIPGEFRIRLGSVEPNYIDREFVELIAHSNHFCPHFHLPLQSGDNEILRRMGRTYTPNEYSAAVETIQQKIPHAGIGCDVMVGFPGENDLHFSHTEELINSLPMLYCHVFTYSAREGTPSYGLTDTVPSHIMKERSRRLRELATRKKAEFLQKQLGRVVTVLFESTELDSWWYGFSESYVKVCCQGNGLANTVKDVRIDGHDGSVAFGKIM